MEKSTSEPITVKLDLFEACKEGNMDVVRKLVNQNTVNSRDSGGRKSTPLHFAAGNEGNVFITCTRNHTVVIRKVISFTVYNCDMNNKTL